MISVDHTDSIAECETDPDHPLRRPLRRRFLNVLSSRPLAIRPSEEHFSTS